MFAVINKVRIFVSTSKGNKFFNDLKTTIMTTATLNIGKKLTVIFGGMVYQKNLSEVTVEAAKYETVILKGLTKIEKLDKYLTKMILDGYSILKTDWRRENEIADGAVDFQITLSK